MNNRNKKGFIVILSILLGYLLFYSIGYLSLAGRKVDYPLFCNWCQIVYPFTGFVGLISVLSVVLLSLAPWFIIGFAIAMFINFTVKSYEERDVNFV